MVNVQRGPVVSLEMLRSVKLRPSQNRRKSISRRPSQTNLALSPASSRFEIFSSCH